MSGSPIEESLSLGQRFVRNVRSIRERAERVRARSMPRAGGLSRSEAWLAIGIAAIAILIVGFAFDKVSIARARDVPSSVRLVFQFLSEMGKSQWELYPAGIAVILLLFGRWDIVPRFARVFWAELGALIAFLFVSIGGAGLIVNILKQPIGRGRPPTFDEFGPFAMDPFRLAYEFQSFPSGHSTTAGAIIAFGFLVLPRLRNWLLAFGLAMAASRVVVGAHYPSDVLAGLLLGYVFSLWLARVFARCGWGFAWTSTGTIRARVAVIEHGFRYPFRTALVFAGLVDAWAGRPIWVPELSTTRRRRYGEPSARRDGRDEP